MKDEVNLYDAYHIAHDFISLIADAVDKIVIGGSIRRKRDASVYQLQSTAETQTVADAEIIVIPTRPSSFLARLDKLIMTEVATNTLYGFSSMTNHKEASYRCLRYKSLKIGVFIATPQTWGYIKWLRTGPDSANTYIMQHAAYAPGVTFSDGAVTWNGYKINIPDEESMFKILGLDYIRPGERTENTYRRAPRIPYPSAEWFLARVVPDDAPATPSQQSLF